MTHDNPIAWECPHGSGIRQFITQAQYERFSPRIKSFYKPYRCTSCTTHADQLAAAMALPEVRALVDAVNVTTIIAHALDDGYIDEKVEDQFRSALDEINTALVPIYAALTPFGKATE